MKILIAQADLNLRLGYISVGTFSDVATCIRAYCDLIYYVTNTINIPKYISDFLEIRPVVTINNNWKTEFQKLG